MAMNARRKGLLWGTVVAVVVLLAVLLVQASAEPAGEGVPVPAMNAQRSGEAPSPPAVRSEAPPPPEVLAGGAAVVPEVVQVAGQAPEEPPRPGPVVDLEALRTELPGNLYWETSAPTQAPEVLRARGAALQRRNALRGKVLSGEATEPEIQQYYDYRRQLSEDSIALASRVLEQYGDRLSEQEQGLYALSIRMHRDRLADIPRNMEEALARKRAQDARREAWLRSGKRE
jgi:hypothetical protein